MRIPAIRLADAHARAGGAAGTYMYEFAWPAPGLGAVHALEVPFVFDTASPDAPLFGPLLGNDPPQDLARTMHGAWVAFATDGDPGWPKYDLEHPGHDAVRHDVARRCPTPGPGNGRCGTAFADPRRGRIGRKRAEPHGSLTVRRCRADAAAGGPDRRRRGYTLRPVPRERQPVLDRLAGASRRFQVHALVELDVTEPAARIGHADPRVSWTGFVIATVARAVAAHPEVNARKAGNQILSFDRVDIGATVERHWQGRTRPGHRGDPARPTTGRAPRSPRCCTGPSTAPGNRTPQTRADRALVRLPGPAAADRDPDRRDQAGRRRDLRAGGGCHVDRDVLQRMGLGHPARAADADHHRGRHRRPTCGPRRPVVVRPLLPLTLSFDHAVIDGAPAARFTRRCAP